MEIKNKTLLFLVKVSFGGVNFNFQKNKVVVWFELQKLKFYSPPFKGGRDLSHFVDM